MSSKRMSFKNGMVDEGPTNFSYIPRVLLRSPALSFNPLNLPAMQEISRRSRLNPWVGRSPGEGNGHPLWYSCLGNPMDRGTWWAIVHGVARVGRH